MTLACANPVPQVARLFIGNRISQKRDAVFLDRQREVFDESALRGVIARGRLCQRSERQQDRDDDVRDVKARFKVSSIKLEAFPSR